MSLPTEAAVSLLALGWFAGFGTALVCRPARSNRTCRELMRDPPGWRPYERLARARLANSDNGGPSTAKPPIEPQGQAPARPQPHGGRQVWADGTPVVPRPPIEPQGQAPVKPGFPPPRKIREGFTVEEIQADNLRPCLELKAESLAHQANVARIEAEQASATARLQAYWASLDTDSQAIANAAARRSGIWQPQANKAVPHADDGDRDPAEAVINDASRLWMRHDMPQPPSPPQVQVREPYSPSHVAECGGPCERIGICDCGNPPNLPAPGKPLHPAPQANS